MGIPSATFTKLNAAQRGQEQDARAGAAQKGT